MEGHALHWAMDTGTHVFKGLLALMTQCLSPAPVDRPRLSAVLSTLVQLRHGLSDAALRQVVTSG